jgi:excisionase family DNA binding protein
VDRKTIPIMKACELVGVSRRTIYNWLSSGKIEYIRTAGGSVRIFVDSLWREPHGTDQPVVDTTQPVVNPSQPVAARTWPQPEAPNRV